MIFQEEQKFRQWWLWLILIGVGLLALFSVYSYLIHPQQSSGSLIEVIITVVVSTVVLVGFWFMKITTIIDKQGIRMRFLPFLKKTITWNDVANATVLDYGFVGGWGIRHSATYGSVYNMKGNMGLHIQLKNGEQFVIGTQKPTELKAFIQKITA